MTVTAACGSPMRKAAIGASLPLTRIGPIGVMPKLASKRIDKTGVGDNLARLGNHHQPGGHVDGAALHTVGATHVATVGANPHPALGQTDLCWRSKG